MLRSLRDRHTVTMCSESSAPRAGQLPKTISRRAPRRGSGSCAVLILALVTMVGCTAGEEEPSLQAALGWGDPDDPESVFAARAEHTQRVQDLIVECMAEQGFEYIPSDIAPDPRADGGMNEEEYRRLHGWGMMSSQAAGLLDKEGWGDPNEERVASLDEPTMYAWYEALHGEDPLDEETRDGCWAESEDTVNTYLETDVWQELETELDALEHRIAADPRTIEAQRHWTRCMAEAGYPFANEDEIIAHLGDAMFDAWEAEPHPETGLLTTYRWSMAPWFLETDTWADLVELELDMAATDDACGEDPEARADLERQFLDDNAALLEQLRDIM